MCPFPAQGAAACIPTPTLNILVIVIAQCTCVIFLECTLELVPLKYRSWIYVCTELLWVQTTSMSNWTVRNILM